jgi:hypothetical protein
MVVWETVHGNYLLFRSLRLSRLNSIWLAIKFVLSDEDSEDAQGPVARDVGVDRDLVQ